MTVKNVLWQPLYDSVGLTTAVARDYDFFKIPVGGLDGAVTKTRFHTNSDIAGQVPNGQRMKVYAFGVSLWNLTDLPQNDAIAILRTAQATLSLTIRNVTYFELPLFKFTSGHGIVQSNVTAGANPVSWTNGWPEPKAIYTLIPKPITLPEQTPFTLRVRFESAPTIATALTRMFVFMEGISSEPVYK